MNISDRWGHKPGLEIWADQQLKEITPAKSHKNYCLSTNVKKTEVLLSLELIGVF